MVLAAFYGAGLWPLAIVLDANLAQAAAWISPRELPARR